MTASPKLDFRVDKATNTMTISRSFNAGRQLVWDCHTRSELLDRWFAPKPFTTKTKSMSFREGGHWHYAMIDPAGPEYWGRTDYQTIRPIEGYTALDAFSNEEGTVAPGMPRGRWEVTFTAAGDRTVVRTVAAYDTLEDLEKVIAMGMQEGMASTMERLDELLAELAPS